MVKVISLPYIFRVLYVFCFTNVKISGERLQDHWSSGFNFIFVFPPTHARTILEVNYVFLVLSFLLQPG